MSVGIGDSTPSTARSCSIYYPHSFLKKRRGYCNRLRPSICPSVRPSVMLSPPKPLDEIHPNLVCELLT